MEVIASAPVLSQEQKERLCRDVSDEEVVKALFSIDPSKAPGPDGFSTGFYKAVWPIIGNDIIEAVHDFFKSGKLLTQLNATNICLIPKVDNPNSLSDYRPISCCNVLYKTITKIVANRVQIVLDYVVGETEAVFVKNRSIVSNILVCQDLVRGYHRDKGPPRCMMKIDLCKAYDSLDWSFLRQVPVGLNFPDCVVHWIMTCISSAHYSVLINGNPEGYFRGERGVRQGDPLSPYLFVLAMEYLARLLNKAQEVTDFKYYAKCKGLKINHLMFADDLMLYCRADLFSPF